MACLGPLTFTVTLICSLAQTQPAAPVWEIGKFDRNYREFALSGDHAAYAKAFPKDIAFVVGRSDPARDWSWIHPGPTDEWAGRREHPFVITFDLPEAPAGLYELRIGILDTQPVRTPQLRVDVNGTAGLFRLRRGRGDAALVDPARGQPQTLAVPVHGSLLRTGANTITLTAVDGSWLLYDALSLHPLAGAGATSLDVEVRPTVFFVKRDGQLRQVVRLRVVGLPPKSPVRLSIAAGEHASEVTLTGPAIGQLDQDIHVTPVERPTELKLTFAGSGVNHTAAFELRPQKRWQIFAAPSTHTDIGYTHVQSEVIAVHNRNTDMAITLCEEFPGYKWNLESSWAAQMFRRDRFDESWRRLLDLARQERIGIEAGYLNMLTGLCSAEELIRNMYYSARLHREHGIPFDSLTITDAPSHVWSMPSILAAAGIRYLSIGSNQTRGPILRHNLHHKSPCWWEGPDGRKVLTNFTDGYAQSARVGLGEPVHVMRDTLERFLTWWNEREDYPFDAVLLHGAYGDNQFIGRQIAESQAAFAREYEYPKVHLGRLADYFRYVEKNFADKIPTVRGCGGSWWEDGAGSTARHTAYCRLSHNRVVAAEMLWATAAMADPSAPFPQETFDRIWDNILLYDEHTWGAHNSISEPWKDFVQEQWAVKAAYATTALEESERLAARGLYQLGRRIGAPAGSILVFNPVNRVRSDVVRLHVPRNHVVFDSNGPVPTQKLGEYGAYDEVVFLAREVPPLGYRRLRCAPSPEGELKPAAETPGNILENRFYRITFDEKTGAIASIVDKETGKELVDPSSPHQLNQVIYAAGGEETRIFNWDAALPEPKLELEKIANARVLVAEPGAVWRTARATGRGRMIEEINNQVILYDHVKRIDFVNRIHKKHTTKKEALYIAFPFAAGRQPAFRFEIGGASVRPNEDHLPGGCVDWFSIQNWLTVVGEGIGIAWTPIDTPLVTLCDLTPGKWLDRLPITNGTVFAYAMNNYWFTNYKACQDGWFEFRYSLTSSTDMPEASASRFGWDVACPMLGIRFDHGEGSHAPASEQAVSFCTVSDPGVQVSTIKRADDGRGIIVRLLEVAGQPERIARLKLGWPGHFEPTKACLCDAVERDAERLAVSQGATDVRIGRYGIVTVRFE